MIENAELIAIIALLGTLFISAVGAAFALGGLPRRGEFNEMRNEMREEISALRKEMNDKIDASNKELSAKMEESHASLVAEIRRSHQQLLRALINHRHLEPEGEPIFTEPPDTELVAADD